MNAEMLIDEFVDKGTNNWKRLVERLSANELQQIESQASYLAVLYAEISEYCGQQGAYGCGGRSHEDAMKAVEKKRKAVRKAVGFIIP